VTHPRQASTSLILSRIPENERLDGDFILPLASVQVFHSISDDWTWLDIIYGYYNFNPGEADKRSFANYLRWFGGSQRFKNLYGARLNEMPSLDVLGATNYLLSDDAYIAPGLLLPVINFSSYVFEFSALPCEKKNALYRIALKCFYELADFGNDVALEVTSVRRRARYFYGCATLLSQVAFLLKNKFHFKKAYAAFSAARSFLSLSRFLGFSSQHPEEDRGILRELYRLDLYSEDLFVFFQSREELLSRYGDDRASEVEELREIEEGLPNVLEACVSRVVSLMASRALTEYPWLEVDSIFASSDDEDDEDEESSLYEGNTSLDRVESAISEGDEEEFDLLGGEGNSWSEDEDAAPDPDSGAYDGVCLR
jgi:hypothetical protein